MTGPVPTGARARIATWPEQQTDPDDVAIQYDGVWRSTGFGPYREAAGDELPAALEPPAAACLPYYAELAEHRIRVWKR